MEHSPATTDEFWTYLVDGGVLDQDLATEFRGRAETQWMPLGQILIKRSALSMAEVMGLLAIQADEPKMRLGDLAVREGLCTRAQISAALAEQRRRSPHPIELLLGDTRVDSAGFFGPLIEYVRWLEGRLHMSHQSCDVV